MLDKINDIKIAINNKAYQSALSLSLTLPAICSEVENWNSEHQNYVKWCDTHIPKDRFISNIPGFESNELNGEVIYQLRCSVLHSGTSNIKQKFGIAINSFSLWADESGQVNFGYEYQKKTINGKETFNTKIDLVYLVETLCECAEDFYNNWPDKTDFDDHVVKIEIR